MENEFDVVVIGGGAAGCFAAIQAGGHFPGARIIILEKGIRPLAKVKISGGGRCNVTNELSDPSELSRNYPRGRRFLKKAFYTFSSNDMVAWLRSKGIRLRMYADGCLFPESNDSQTIIDCFLDELKRLQITLCTELRVDRVEQQGQGWRLVTNHGEFLCKSVVVTTGGQPKISGFQLLQDLDLAIVPPLPSLFTFNMPDEPIRELMGIVAEDAVVKVAGEKWASEGPLLITHWGMSGPAVLKSSAFGARVLAGMEYRSPVLVNWTGGGNPEKIRSVFADHSGSSKKMSNTPLFRIRSRLWNYLLAKAGISEDRIWAEAGPKQLNRLVEILCADQYSMQGKTTFKEEFVTAGGIDLGEIDVKTMQSKKYPGLFFAGEVMDIDGITGGYNFQAAWTTAFIAGKSVLLNS